MRDSIDAVLMAGGQSRRFGKENKLLSPFCGKPLAQYAIELVCGVKDFRTVYLVWAAEAVAALAGSRTVTGIYNAHPECGPGESVRLGTLASDADYYMFFPCDQPLLDLQTVQAVLAARRPGYIVSPSFQGKPGNPALFSSSFRNELLALRAGEAARQIKQRHPGQLLDVPQSSAMPLWDIDTPEDLRKLERLAAGLSGARH